MNPFVNYWHTPYRGSSLNLAVARVLVCVFAAWKVLAYPFAGIAAYPPFLIGGAQELGAWLPHFASWVGWEQGVAVVCLVACAAGLAPGFTAYAAALLVSHLSAIVYPVSYEKTWLLIVYFLLLYGVYRHEDHFVFRRRPAFTPRDGLRHAGASDERTPMHALKWFLVTIATIYFLTGLHKLSAGGWHIEWTTPTNMSRMLERRTLIRGDPLPGMAQWLQQQPFLMGAAGWGALLLELGLLPAVVTNRFMTPCTLGLAAMHLGIWATMDLNYFTDFGWMYLVFVPWDRLLDSAKRKGR
jgi:hypothetical protein